MSSLDEQSKYKYRNRNCETVSTSPQCFLVFFSPRRELKWPCRFVPTFSDGDDDGVEPFFDSWWGNRGEWRETTTVDQR
jgi:hypothetical protein